MNGRGVSCTTGTIICMSARDWCPFIVLLVSPLLPTTRTPEYTPLVRKYVGRPLPISQLCPEPTPSLPDTPLWRRKADGRVYTKTGDMGAVGKGAGVAGGSFSRVPARRCSRRWLRTFYTQPNTPGCHLAGDVCLWGCVTKPLGQ